MTKETPRFALRWAAIAAIVHAVVVSIASMVYCLLLGKQVSWAAARFLRVIDWPVYWAIERGVSEASAVLLKDGYRLPASWPLDTIWTAVLFLSFFHVVIGGAFYAVLAAIVALVIHRRRKRRAGIAQGGTAVQETRA